QIDDTQWLATTDYTLIIHTQLTGGILVDGVHGSYRGQFRLFARNGRRRDSRISHAGTRTYDDAGYLTLIWAVDALIQTISEAGRDPSSYTLTVYSARELIVKQLTGQFMVKAQNLKHRFEEARHLLGHFKSVEVVWKQGDGIKRLLPR